VTAFDIRPCTIDVDDEPHGCVVRILDDPAGLTRVFIAGQLNFGWAYAYGKGVDKQR